MTTSEMAAITVIMSGQPIPWARTRRRFDPQTKTLTNQFIEPAKQRNAAATFRMLAQQEMAGRPPIADAVRVDIVAEFSIPASMTKKDRALIAAGQKWPDKRPDEDNIGKLLKDGANGVIWKDDKQIVDCRIRKIYSNTPRVTLQCVRMVDFLCLSPHTIVAASPHKIVAASTERQTNGSQNVHT